MKARRLTIPGNRSYPGSCAFVLLFCLSAAAACVRPPAPDLVVAEAWDGHSDLALTLSRGVLTGMRYLMSDLLLSEGWFEDLDVTFQSDSGFVLEATIKDFYLATGSGPGLFSEWQVFRNFDFELELTTTVFFREPGVATTPSQTWLPAASDSLRLDIYQSSSEIAPLAHAPDASQLNIVFWRDKATRDSIISLKLERNEAGEFVVWRAKPF